MASIALQIIPAVSGPTPTAAQLDSARQLLQSYLSYVEGRVEAKAFSKPRLVDTGAAFESMVCPLCQTEIDRFGDDEHGEWWDEMEAQIAESSAPLTEMLTMPCCQQDLAAQALDFGAHARFVDWMLRANDYELPSGDTELAAEQLAAIGAALGCEVRQLICVNG